MKHIIFGFVGIGVVIYTVLSVLSVYQISVSRNALQHCCGQLCEHALERFAGEDYVQIQEVEAFLQNELNTDAHTAQLEVLSCDMQKGLIAICVWENLSLPNGFTKRIVSSRTAILETDKNVTQQIQIEFYVNDSLYKSYFLEKGADYRIPRNPAGAFLGWRNRETGAWIKEDEQIVECEQIYDAVFED